MTYVQSWCLGNRLDPHVYCGPFTATSPRTVPHKPDVKHTHGLTNTCIAGTFSQGADYHCIITSKLTVTQHCQQRPAEQLSGDTNTLGQLNPQ